MEAQQRDGSPLLVLRVIDPRLIDRSEAVEPRRAEPTTTCKLKTRILLACFKWPLSGFNEVLNVFLAVLLDPWVRGTPR